MARYENHRRIYEKHHGIKIPKGMHIHHIDGNKLNNDISNLLMVTPEEHCKIHLEQGDPWYNSKYNKWISGASQAGKLGGSKSKGRKVSDETREKLSKAGLGRKMNPEVVRKVSEKRRGQKRTYEQRKRMSESQKKLYSDGYVSHRRGKKASEETKKKLSQSHIGIPNNQLGLKRSEESKKRMSNSHKGIKLSESHRLSIGKSHLGLKYKKRKQSEDTSCQ